MNSGQEFLCIVEDSPVKVGFTPYLKYKKRHWILKRLRNARQFSAAVPRTNATCNSQKLANVMVKVMSEDVSVSKRAIVQSTEMAFDGDKYDVFCANGEFSYSIHSRKYCEVTKNGVTCFAFR
ncbi:ground-like domain protein [Teladorsagia circumcincta]|uniref:Ground-like domain protein n=1 Tax=Teladorsagia circumcincta TaxID=45464 RepID=A0A2G9UDL4_TELCI|nr:ground-like domain protein [Teladorsagia circumcincta]